MTPDREKVIRGLESCLNNDCHMDKCPYCEFVGNEYVCLENFLMRDALALLKEQEEEHKRLLSWLSKFCRHIDNGDKWLTDEENLAFFKEKMKQQFDWDTD